MPRRNQPVKAAARKTPPLTDSAEEGDLNLRERLTQDQGSYQSGHDNTGFGDDDEHADGDEAKVQGRSRG